MMRPDDHPASSKDEDLEENDHECPSEYSEESDPECREDPITEHAVLREEVKRCSPQNEEAYWDGIIDDLRREIRISDWNRRAYEREHGKGTSPIFNDFNSPLSTNPHGINHMEQKDLERAIREVEEIRAKWHGKEKKSHADPSIKAESPADPKSPLSWEELQWYHTVDFRELDNPDKVRYVSVFLTLRGATLISDKYTTNKDAYRIHCKKCENDFYSSFNNLQAGHWCPTCRGTHVISFSDVKSLVEFKGGTLISTEYKNNHSPLEIRCKEGHDFTTTYNMLQKGRWCPHCHIYIGEEITRNYFERIFNAEFPKTKPKWLLSEKGYPMELDGYCEKLKIGFEYQGMHTETNKHFRVDENRLKQIQAHDKFKRNLCEKNGVTLIAIPPENEVPYGKIQDYILSEYQRITGIELKDIPKYDYVSFDINPIGYLQKADEIITAKGGTLISKTFIDCRHKLDIKCKKEHDFKMNLNALRDDDWCPICSKKQKHTIEEARKLVEENGWTLVSTEYENNSTPLEIICDKGHQIKMSFLAIDQGQHCGICSRKAPHTLEDAQNLASQRGGVLVSTEYVRNNFPLKVICARNHSFTMTFTDMQGGHWCRYCAKDYTYTPEQKQTYIKNRGGKLMGKIIPSSDQSLQILCNSCNEIFERTFKEILKGNWCPNCPDKIRIRKFHSSDCND